MDALLSAFGFVLVLGIIILVHEGGHYLAAKRLGIRVRRFSIGMGPIVWRRNAWNTEFALSLLPIGGYVMFVEKSDEDAAQGAGGTGLLFTEAARWKRALVAAAGPFMNFALALVLFAAVGAIGTKDIVPYLGAAPNTPAAHAGILPMDKALAVNGEPVAGLSDLQMELTRLAGEREVRLTLERRGAPVETTLNLADFSVEDAADPAFLFKKVGLRISGESVLVRSVEKDGPAARAGLRTGDLILTVNGEKASVERFIDVVKASPEKPVVLTLERLADAAKGEMKPLKIELTPRALTDEATGVTAGRADLTLAPGFEMTVVRHGPVESVRRAAHKIWTLTALQWTAVSGMAQGDVKADAMQGPVGIAGMAGDAVSAGMVVLLDFVAVLSVAIGFMNLIPIPALDGGQLVILGVEGALGRDLPEAVRGWLTRLSVGILLALMVFVTFNDIGRLAG